MLSAEETNRLISVFEETAGLGIVPMLNGKGKIRMCLAYSEMMQKTACSFYYDATDENLLDKIDPISMQMIAHNVDSIEHMKSDDPNWKAKIQALIKSSNTATDNN